MKLGVVYVDGYDSERLWRYEKNDNYDFDIVNGHLAIMRDGAVIAAYAPVTWRSVNEL